jgi:hypothetical protein
MMQIIEFGSAKDFRIGWQAVVRFHATGNFFPRRQKIFFDICEKARVFRAFLILGEIFPQHLLA